MFSDLKSYKYKVYETKHVSSMNNTYYVYNILNNIYFFWVYAIRHHDYYILQTNCVKHNLSEECNNPDLRRTVGQ